MINTNIQINGVGLNHVGWKYYNSIVKKAMEQEFSWSGLSISLSIAFFVVVFSAQGLNMTYEYMSEIERQKAFPESQIYRLESASYRNDSVNHIALSQFI